MNSACAGDLVVLMPKQSDSIMQNKQHTKDYQFTYGTCFAGCDVFPQAATLATIP